MVAKHGRLWMAAGGYVVCKSILMGREPHCKGNIVVV